MTSTQRQPSKRVTSRLGIVGQPPRKPLYLMTSHNARIDANGAALFFKSDSLPAQTFPLARITRIVCRNHIDWTGRALSTCLAEGIVIVWVDGHGHANGHACAAMQKPDSLSTLFDHYLELKDWPRRLQNWQARRRLAALISAAKRRLENGHPLDATEFATIKHDYIHLGELHPRFDPQVQAWCHALTLDRLNKIGLADCYYGFDGTRLDLAAVLTDLLWAELNIEAGNLATSHIPNPTLARIFETWAIDRERHLLDHLGDLHRHMRREVEAWH